MARRPTPDNTIGQRIHDRRMLQGLSLRDAASRAGLSHTTLGRIEKGQLSADNRFTLAAIAEALRCSVADLTTAPNPANSDQDLGLLLETMRAVTESDLAYGPLVAAPPLQTLRDTLALVDDLRLRCDYDGAARLIPDLIRGLHAIASTPGPEQQEALRLLVVAHDTTSFVVRYNGQPASAALVSERAQQAAERLNEPVMLALAAWSKFHSATGLGLYPHALAIAERASADLAPHVNQANGREMLGGLHLSAAFALYAVNRKDEAAARLTEAARIAEDTGDSMALRLSFGPTNINLWKISMFADGSDPGEAVAIAGQTNPEAIMAVSRRASFYIDSARAITHASTENDTRAIRLLLTAERIAPQRVRRSPMVQETVRDLLDRARKGTGFVELKGLCERVGVPL